MLGALATGLVCVKVDFSGTFRFQEGLQIIDFNSECSAEEVNFNFETPWENLS